MNFVESLLTGLDEARRHWGQTLLSLLGLILGTASIVTVLALFGGQTALTEQFLSEVGGRGTIIVSDREASAKTSGYRRRQYSTSGSKVVTQIPLLSEFFCRQ